MGSIEQLWHAFWDIFRHGWAQISHPIVGVLIALLAGLAVQSFVGIFFIAALAVIVHVVAEIAIPMVMNHAPMALPRIDDAFTQYALTLYVAYFVVILVIFGVKRVFSSVRG